jgi:superfamily II DNA or RNA helicase
VSERASGGQRMLPNTLIQKHVGQTSFSRGRAYANKGRARNIEADAESGRLAGSVQGSADRPYTVQVTLARKSDKAFTIKTSDCSCPVGYACKHVAALLISGRETLYGQTVQEAELITDRSRNAAARKQGEWEKGLDTLLAGGKPQHYTPLALLFELVPVTHYNYPNYYDLPQGFPKPTIRLGLRLASLNVQTGRWVMNEISWKRLRGIYLHEFDPDQLVFVGELWSLYASRQRYYYEDKYLFLDDFHSPLLGDMLVRGQALGIRYLHYGRDREPIALLSRPAEHGLGIAPGEQGDLALKQQVEIDGHVVPPAQLGFIGRPAHAVYIWDGNQQAARRSSITLASLAQPVTADQQVGVIKGKSLQIPKADVPRFTRRYYPKLAQKVRLSADAELGMPLPQFDPPRLQVLVRMADSGQAVEVGWQWEYQLDGETFHLSLLSSTGEEPVARFEAFEDELRQKVERLCLPLKALWGESNSAARQLTENARLRGMDAVIFIQQILPELHATQNVEVVQDGKLPGFQEFTERPTIELGMHQDSGDASDWFNLMVSVKLGEEEVPFQMLFTALAEGEPYLLLESGSYFRLDHPELERLRKLIEEARSLQDKPSDELRLSPFQASLWDELQALGVVTQQAKTWENSIKGLLDVQYIPKVPLPKNLKAQLRPYQKEGYQWLCFLWEHRLGGILADDMGLGKTLQTIALLLRMKAQTPAKDRRPVLIIAPTSVAANWVGELERFAPSLKIVYLRGQKEAAASALAKADVVISTYALLRLNFDDYQAIKWSALVLDEAQFVKNHQSKGYAYARKLNAPFKLALSGTPLENNLMELWALLSIAAPGLFPSPKRFGDFYQRPIEKEGDREVMTQLRRRVRPLMLRRTKDKVATELPPKIEQTLELELLPEHQRVYDTYLARERQRVLGLLGDLDKNRFMIFKSLTTLRLLSLDPKIVDPKKYAKIPSTKLAGLFEQLEEVLSEGHRALIFSQFTKFLGAVRAELDRRGTPYLYLDGTTKNRAELLKKFKESDTPLFLISLKAGGFGLNLTEADYCFLLDPWWNPAVEQQAVDRTHRIGQTKQVIVYRLVSKGTIEEKVMALKAKKAKLFKNVMDDEALFASAVTAEDIRSLFE